MRMHSGVASLCFRSQTLDIRRIKSSPFTVNLRKQFFLRFIAENLAVVRALPPQSCFPFENVTALRLFVIEWQVNIAQIREFI